MIAVSAKRLGHDCDAAIGLKEFRYEVARCAVAARLENQT